MTFFNRGDRDRDEDREELISEHRELKVLQGILTEVKSINEFIRTPRVSGVIFVFPSEINKLQQGDNMADLVLNQGQSAPVELHYVDTAGNDLGLVPAGDSPSISTDQPAELGVTVNGSTATLSNANTGNGDVDVNLSGVAKGFTTTAVVTCKGTSTPPPVPAGVKFVFGTPTP